MRICLELVGQTPLVQHNIQLADERNEYKRAIDELTAKRGKDRTDSENAEIEKLEWFGGLYHDPDVGIYVPSWSIVRCLERGGTLTRQGSTVVRALAVMTDKVPLEYDGPPDPKDLWERPEFRWRTMVGVDRKRVPRMRPIFRRWALSLEAELLDDVMNLRDLAEIAARAGRSEGLGDARKLGNGRFMVKVTAA